jgi:hypothetical protein
VYRHQPTRKIPTEGPGAGSVPSSGRHHSSVDGVPAPDSGVGRGPTNGRDPTREVGGDGSVTEVIRPAAVVPEEAARTILIELSLRDFRSGGLWLANPSSWHRYDRPFGDPPAPGGEPRLIGTIQIAHGTPTKYEITIFRVSVTSYGSQQGWSVQSLSDEALGFGDLTLADCPRANLDAPPKPFRF